MVRDGYFYGLALLLVAAAVLWWTGGQWGWAVVPVLLAAFFLWFFRDPERVIPNGPGVVVSPADGLVTSVARVTTPTGERVKLSVFLSVFDVHVNRSPLAGVIREVRYEKGLFLNAMNPESADKNEQNTVVVAGEGCEVAFKQIAGLLARRIVFKKRVGDQVRRGERVGLIKFGSRVDILLPGDAAIAVKKGDRVKGGASVLATLRTVATVGATVTSEAAIGLAAAVETRI
jgi:phosphatidylserine decarboxylase